MFLTAHSVQCSQHWLVMSLICSSTAAITTSTTTTRHLIPWHHPTLEQASTHVFKHPSHIHDISRWCLKAYYGKFLWSLLDLSCSITTKYLKSLKPNRFILFQSLDLFYPFKKDKFLTLKIFLILLKLKQNINNKYLPKILNEKEKHLYHFKFKWSYIR